MFSFRGGRRSSASQRPSEGAAPDPAPSSRTLGRTAGAFSPLVELLTPRRHAARTPGPSGLPAPPARRSLVQILATPFRQAATTGRMGRPAAAAPPSLREAVNAWNADAINLIHRGDPTRAEHRANAIHHAASAILEADARQLPALELSYVPAPNLPEALGQLTHLQMLSIANSRAIALPASIGNLQRLERLQLAGLGRLKILPPAVSCLGTLKHLVVQRTPLQSLPPNIDALRNLREIWLSGGTYATLPDSIVNLGALTTLSVEEPASPEHSLIRLPHRLGALGSLQHLQIKGHARLAALPDSINQLRNLATLWVENCPLVMLPNALDGLPALQTLCLNGCDKLVRLPDSITSITGLRKLELSGCQGLVSLPREIGQLSNLQCLDLSGCTSLAELPSSLSKLPRRCRITVPEHLKAQLETLRPPAASTRRGRRHAEPSAASSSRPPRESRTIPPRDSHPRATPTPPR